MRQLLVAAAADPRFDEREIADNVLTMLLAGEDTTANTLAWALYFLAGHPKVQERLAAEVVATLPEGRLTDFDQLRELPWLDAVIQETMRLKPVAPLNIVEANRDLDIGPLRLRKGDQVAILTRAIALAEPAFTEAGFFDPERWLRASADRRGFNPHSFMPFGSGPRLCPGRSLALLEMKAVLALVAARMEVEPACHLSQVRERLAFTMSPQGLRLRLNPRA
jgi:cytochrome P450